MRNKWHTFAWYVRKIRLQLKFNQKNFCSIHSLESSFVCVKCSVHFNMGFEVTHRESSPNAYRNPSEGWMNNPCESDDGAKEVQFENQNENDMPKQAFERSDKPVCLSTFTHKRNLTSHKKKNELNPFICEQYNKNFETENNLSLYMAEYSDERPHKCNFCPRTFKGKPTLNRHMKKNKNPFIGKLCNKSCDSQGHLPDHMAKHSDERPHKCIFCHKTFKLKSHLTRHLKNHNEQNYS